MARPALRNFHKLPRFFCLEAPLPFQQLVQEMLEASALNDAVVGNVDAVDHKLQRRLLVSGS
eukprot:16431623-Heterocapsa_arctica.AAC.1